MAVPTVCADGGMGVPPVFSNQSPNVTLLNPSQSLPSSLRADLGYRTQLFGMLPVNLRYSWSLGLGLWGYQDLNLDEDRTFTVETRGGPSTAALTPSWSGPAPRRSATSRINPDVRSGLRRGHRSPLLDAPALGAGHGRGPAHTTLMANYTLGFSRDQGSAGGGLGRFGGGGGGMFPPTAGSPNEVPGGPPAATGGTR
jgi:hypothetical protein